ncbi:MAG: hypothetical protein B6D37_03635 [Sphingobacteriales bacterium UTBCD1]|jgi:hypothetical protein|nr:MAG: hypothetical protein B6D37_03635 [Sphingobacteriales bacterium UTBCD1]
MKHAITSLINFLFSMTMMQSLISQSGTFGHLIYTVPPGWKETKYQNGIQLGISPAPRELLTIQILQSMNFSGTMEQALEKSYDETCTILQVTKMREVSGLSYTAKDPKRSFKGWEYIRCSGGIHVNNGTPYPDEYGLELFVLKINNRFERIAIVKSRNTCGGLSRYYPSDRLSFHNAIEDFLFSLKFDDWTEPVVANGTLNGNVFTGVWQGLSLSVGLSKPGAPLGAELTVKHLILFSNGQAYFGKNFPFEGLDELNTWISAENDRRDWGYYSFNSSRGFLKLPYEEIPMRVENNKLIITTNKTDHGFIKQSPVDGTTFNGTYTMSEAYGIIPSISFSSDGRFVDKGAVRVLYHDNNGCTNPGITGGSGTYEVKNHSLIFSYSDGRKIKIAITGSGLGKNNPDPHVLILSFNEDRLSKQ